ncbi:MAG: hypothetical protein OXC11_11145 [Rhodospirillales bacterium]|nr:hypothetical protein [Rhodospirillales bacterium]
MAVEHGKSRAEVGLVLRTLSALSPPLSVNADDHPPPSSDDVAPGDIDAAVNAAREDPM